MPARDLQIYTEARAGGDRRYLGAIGLVSGVEFTTQIPGGDATFSCFLDTDPARHHAALRAGRLLTVNIGGRRWRGQLDQPVPGTPWQIQAIGVGSMGQQFPAVPSTGSNAYDLPHVVANAISLGLPWVGGASLPTAGSAPSGSVQVDAAMSAVGRALGQIWTIDANGNAAMGAVPTAPTYVLQTGQPLVTTTDGFITYGWARYQSSSTATALISYAYAAAEAIFGRFGATSVLDLTSYGVISSATALSYLTAYVQANGPRLKTAQDISAAPGQLLTPGGVAVDIATVRAGCLVQLQSFALNREVVVAPSGPISVLIGKTKYAGDTDTLTLTPLGDSRHDLISLLYQGAA